MYLRVEKKRVDWRLAALFGAVSLVWVALAGYVVYSWFR